MNVRNLNEESPHDEQGNVILRGKQRDEEGCINCGCNRSICMDTECSGDMEYFPEDGLSKEASLMNFYYKLITVGGSNPTPLHSSMQLLANADLVIQVDENYETKVIKSRQFEPRFYSED